MTPEKLYYDYHLGIVSSDITVFFDKKESYYIATIWVSEYLNNEKYKEHVISSNVNIKSAIDRCLYELQLDSL